MKSYVICLSITGLLLVSVSTAYGQGQSPWRAHDLERPRPPIVTPAPISSPRKPPSDAILLFDGSDLSQWEATDGGQTQWVLEDGVMMPTQNSGPIRSKTGFGDVQLHLEWAAPTPPKGNSQGRGNSGIYMMGLYEVQILDSYNNETYADGQCASMYGQNPPLVNANLPPGEWQSYDIVFRRPRFDASGNLSSPATMTVIQNGVLVQDHFELWGPTNWLRFDQYQPHADKLPISLQDHGNPVRFRNIWVRELADTPRYTSPAEATAKTQLSTTQLQNLVGVFRGTDGAEYKTRVHDDGLQIGFQGRYFDLVPFSDHVFDFKHTFAKVSFDVGNDGSPVGITVDVMGEKRPAKAE